MLDILLISYGVGGSQALNPIYLALKDEYNVENVSLTDFAQNYLSDGLLIKEPDIYEYIITNRPSLVINERSNGVEIQNRITKHCKEKG